jgi:hypothetical protein
VAGVTAFAVLAVADRSRVALVHEVELPEQRVDALIEIVAGDAVGERDQLEVVVEGQVRIRRRAVRNDSHRCSGLDPRPLVVDRGAGNHDAPGAWS